MQRKNERQTVRNRTLAVRATQAEANCDRMAKELREYGGDGYAARREVTCVEDEQNDGDVFARSFGIGGSDGAGFGNGATGYGESGV